MLAAFMPGKEVHYDLSASRHAGLDPVSHFQIFKSTHYQITSLPTQEASQHLTLYSRINLEMFRFAQHDKEEADCQAAALEEGEAPG